MVHTRRMAGMAIGILLLTIAYAAGQKSPVQPPVQGIVWQTRLEEARQLAQKNKKVVLVDFMAEWCQYCKMLDDSTFPDQAVIKKLRVFVPVKIDVDKQKALADKYGANARKNGGMGIPNILFLSPDGKKLKHIVGYRNPKAFVAVLDSVLMIADN